MTKRIELGTINLWNGRKTLDIWTDDNRKHSIPLSRGEMQKLIYILAKELYEDEHTEKEISVKDIRGHE